MIVLVLLLLSLMQLLIVVCFFKSRMIFEIKLLVIFCRLKFRFILIVFLRMVRDVSEMFMMFINNRKVILKIVILLVLVVNLCIVGCMFFCFWIIVVDCVLDQWLSQKIMFLMIRKCMRNNSEKLRLFRGIMVVFSCVVIKFIKFSVQSVVIGIRKYLLIVLNRGFCMIFLIKICIVMNRIIWLLKVIIVFDLKMLWVMFLLILVKVQVKSGKSSGINWVRNLWVLVKMLLLFLVGVNYCVRGLCSLWFIQSVVRKVMISRVNCDQVVGFSNYFCVRFQF